MPKRLKVFSLGFYMWRQTLQVIGNFPTTTRVWSKISYGGEWTSPQTVNHFLCIFSGKIFFFSTSWKYWRLPIWLKTLNPKGYAAKYRYQKSLDVVRSLSIARTSETVMSHAQEIKTFSAKNKCNSVNFGVVTIFKFRYSVVKFLLVWFSQLTGLRPPLGFRSQNPLTFCISID